MKSTLLLIHRASLPTALLTLFLLVSCTQTPTTGGTVTEPAVSVTTAPVETAIQTQAPEQSETAAQTDTPSPAPSPFPTAQAATSSPGVHLEGEVINLDNISQIQLVEGISIQDARLFAWMPDSQALVVANQDNIVFYSLNPLQETRRFNAPAATMLAVSPDGDLIAWTGEDNAVHIWSQSEGSEIHNLGPHTSAITGIVFSPDGTILAISNSSEDSIELWDPRNGQNIQNWKLPYWVTNLSFSPDGKSLGGVEQASFNVHIWSVPSGEEQTVLTWTEVASPVLYGAYFTPDWKTLAWVSRGTVQLMDMATGNMGPSLGHEDFVSAISLSADGALIATAAAGTVGDKFLPVVYLWNVSTGEQVHNLPQEQPVTSLAFSPDGRSLAILTSDNMLNLWEVPQ